MSLVAQTDGFLEVLQDTRLLSCARYVQLVEELIPACDDWSIIGRELIYRQWLTPFQVKRLLQGRGNELVLGSYVLQEPLGEGGMGRVYRSLNWKLGTLAAVKVIRRNRAGDPSAVKRFLREVQAMGAIRHPNVVYALDADLENGRLYCVTEYVPCMDLANLLKERGALPIEVACRYAAQLAEGLRHISAHGLVHRDVKPANILVTEDGSTVKLLDLGLARFEHPDWEAAASDLTQVGMMVGTPDYVSPEQIRDSRHADIRSDLYSLGCTLYHMLTGQAPFANAAIIDKLYLHQATEPLAVEQLRSDVPPRLATVVRKLMAKRPRDRYQDPSEVATTLRPYLISSSDTLRDAILPTNPGIPLRNPEQNLAPTDEIPTDLIPILKEEEGSIPQVWMGFVNRFHWLIATLIAGVAMGFVIGRG